MQSKTINLETIKDLRYQTGAGIKDIKQALEEANGDDELAKKLLKEKGKLLANKKSSREAKEGWLGSYIHNNGKVGAVVELICETDFVARNQEFQELAHDLAMQITASCPGFVKAEDAQEQDLKGEIAEIEKELIKEEKPAEIKEKIKKGKIEKLKKEISLYSQSFVKDPSKTIEDLINEKIMKLGEKIVLRKFYYFSI